MSTRRLLWGKALALAGSVSLLLLPGALLVGGLTLASTHAGTMLDVLARLAGLGLGHGMYLGAVVFLVLTVWCALYRSRCAAAYQ